VPDLRYVSYGFASFGVLEAATLSTIMLEQTCSRILLLALPTLSSPEGTKIENKLLLCWRTLSTRTAKYPSFSVRRDNCCVMRNQEEFVHIARFLKSLQVDHGGKSRV
jgi:hypothetical protein